MDDPRSQSSPSITSTAWRDWHWLVLLFALVIPLRGWLLFNTEVLARDSVGFIRIALQLEEKPWSEVLRSFDQHPGYPTAIWLVSIPVRAWIGETTPEGMQLSAQLVSSLAALLLVIPMFYLGKALWDARVGFGGVLLYQCLPLSGRHLADGISESLFVCFVAWTLLCGIWALQTRRARWFVGCGALAGLAYLTRPEGVIVLAAVGFLFVLMQVRRDERVSWGRFVMQGACLLVPALAVGSLYFVPTGKLTNKPSINHLMVQAATTLQPAPVLARPALMAQLWADQFIEVNSPGKRVMRGSWALVSELIYALHYLGCVPLLIGLIWQGKALWRNRCYWLLAAYFCLHAAGLLLLARSAGYLSDRHLMPLIMILCCLVMVGVLEIARWLACWKISASDVRFGGTVTAAALVLLAVEVLAGMPQTVRRLHGNRDGNRDAGRWLAQRLKPGDMVLDDHDWSHYYSGQILLEGREVPAPHDYQPTCYVVITRSNDFKVKYVRQKRERELQFSQGEIVYHWPTTIEPSADARIVIYALPRNQKVHPWRVAQY